MVTIALLVVAAGAHAAISAGQRLQLNFTDGWHPEGATPGGNPADFSHWNFYLTQNSGYNTTTDNTTDMVDYLGSTVAGVSLAASGWDGVNWNGEVVWPNEYVDNTDWIWWSQYVNFWWAFEGPDENLAIHGLDTNLLYNVRLYALNPHDPGTGTDTEITLNGNKIDGDRQGDRWHSATAATPFRWTGVSATPTGGLVFRWNATEPNNPVLNAIVIEAVPPPSPVPDIGDIAGESLSGTNAFVITWDTGDGFSYALESKTNLLTSNNWTTNTVVAGTGGTVSVTTAVDQSQSFFHVRAGRSASTTSIECQEFVKIFDQSVGESEPWYINDHCFVQGVDGKWHLFGITHEEPANPLDEDNFAHATADSLLQQPWDKQPFALTVASGPPWNEEHLWAPHVVFHDGTYYMYYCAGGADDTEYKIHMATSTDLESWVRHPENPMVVDGLTARDPCIVRHGNEWVMYYTATRPVDKGNHVVIAVTSDDLIHWSNKRVVFTHYAVGTYGGPTESPFVVERNSKFYLFICSNMPYNHTAVYGSGSPFGWDIKDKVGDIPAHAAEVISLPNDKWYISRAGWEKGGVYLAKLIWND